MKKKIIPDSTFRFSDIARAGSALPPATATPAKEELVRFTVVLPAGDYLRLKKYAWWNRIPLKDAVCEALTSFLQGKDIPE